MIIQRKHGAWSQHLTILSFCLHLKLRFRYFVIEKNRNKPPIVRVYNLMSKSTEGFYKEFAQCYYHLARTSRANCIDRLQRLGDTEV